MAFRRVSLSTRIFSKRNSVLTWIGRRPILIVKVGDELYAMDAVCAHVGCALLTEVQDYAVTCPAHEAVYDIRTGQLLAEAKVKPELPCEEEALHVPLRTHRAREKEGFIEIDF
jgi:nitrite reductase/ring-hydroxylating ferredoxin subunit